MTTLLEASRLALEALERIDEVYMSIPLFAEEAATALRQAIEQAQKQECYCGNITRLGVVHRADTFCDEHPEQAQKQEPVAFMDKGKFEHLKKNNAVLTTVTSWGAFDDDVALYTSPPQRQWVGLTDEERKACMRLSEYHIEEVARAVEDTLKRKNK